MFEELNHEVSIWEGASESVTKFDMGTSGIYTIQQFALGNKDEEKI